MEKPSGCILWILVTPALQLQSYLWFGGLPREPLPDIKDMKVAKHTKANAKGIKAELPNQRIIPRKEFTRLETLDEVLQQLFGLLP